MPAGQPEGFLPAAFNPFEYSAFTDLTVRGYVPGGQSDITPVVALYQGPPFYQTFVMPRVFLLFLTKSAYYSYIRISVIKIHHKTWSKGNKKITKI
jgi:hypothetical protein